MPFVSSGEMRSWPAATLTATALSPLSDSPPGFLEDLSSFFSYPSPYLHYTPGDLLSNPGLGYESTRQAIACKVLESLLWINPVPLDTVTYEQFSYWLFVRNNMEEHLSCIEEEFTVHTGLEYNSWGEY